MSHSILLQNDGLFQTSWHTTCKSVAAGRIPRWVVHCLISCDLNEKRRSLRMQVTFEKIKRSGICLAILFTNKGCFAFESVGHNIRSEVPESKQMIAANTHFAAFSAQTNVPCRQNCRLRG